MSNLLQYKNKPKVARSPLQKRAHGFTLVEIMVALVIGMLGIVVIMQIFSIFEGQKRTTTGGDDAQNAGAIALYGVQRDIRHAGYGINDLKLIGCNVTLPDTSSGATVPVTPVIINSPAVVDGDDYTDTLLIFSGNSNSPPEGSVITAQLAQNSYTIDSPNSFLPNDMVIAELSSRPTPCSLKMEKVTAVSPPNIGVATGETGMLKGTLYNMGQLPKILAYRVYKGTLMVCDYLVNNCGDSASKDAADVWAPIGDNIVSLRAQYGTDTTPTMDGVVDLYTRSIPSVSTVESCNLFRIESVRIALVARNGQPEKTEVTKDNDLAWRGTEATSEADGSLAPYNEVGVDIRLDQTVVADGFTWKNYRYKIFQTVIPLRNINSVIVEGLSSGC